MNQEPLILEQTEDTPAVSLNPASGEYFLRGRSLPENPYLFYKPIVEWLTSYLANSRDPQIALTINLDYFNSSSGRYLLEIFSLLEKAGEDSGTIAIIWEVDEEDELMLEKGEEYQELLRIPVSIRPL